MRLLSVSLACVLAVACLHVAGSEGALFDFLADTITRPIASILHTTAHFADRLTGRQSQSSNYNNGGIQSRAAPMARSSYRESDAEQEEADSYQAKCLRDRQSNMRKDASLYFFSKREHGPDTLGCREDRKIVLTPKDDDHSSLSLGVDQIQRDLVNSGRYVAVNPTYFIVHGFSASWDSSSWQCNLKDMILNNSVGNVFIVDWSGGAKPNVPFDYGAAVANTNYVSDVIADFINKLLKASGQGDASNFHLIGHSLGAHISGFIGYSVPSLGRITGLDPAGPCFHSDSEEVQAKASTTGQLQSGKRRLSPDSAKFVMALHTDGSLFGLNENCAHYDIYVNGGHHQPKCSTLNPANRLMDLLTLNLDSALDTDIGCAHSYSQRLVETFERLFNYRRNNKDLGYQLLSANLSVRGDEDATKCHPMAYQCEDWGSYKTGECGFCQDADERCVLSGLDLSSSRVDSPPIPSKFLYNKDDHELTFQMDKVEDTDDDKFNDEDYNADENGDSSETNKHLNDPHSRGQYFIKTGPYDPICLYTYQLIVATTRHRGDMPEKKFFYLHLPLELSGLLVDKDGNREHDRLVQISHTIDPNSVAHKFLAGEYLATVGGANPQLGRQLQQQQQYPDELQFYSAMITFVIAPKEKCVDGQLIGNKRSRYWELCQPLSNMKEARLWSAKHSELNSVQWVAMNYMSAVTLAERMQNSRVFVRAQNAAIESRDDIDKQSRASMDELAPKQPRSASSVISSVSKPFDCMLSLFDRSPEGSAATNYKCDRSSHTLRYGVRLQPVEINLPNLRK